MQHSWIWRRSEMDFGHWGTWELLQLGIRRLEQGSYPDLPRRFLQLWSNQIRLGELYSHGLNGNFAC